MHDYQSAKSQTTPQHAKSAHPLAEFDFRAAVDRIRIQITLSRATQAHALRRHLPPEWYEPYVKGADQLPSHTDTRFSFWIQDPAGPDAIEAGLRSLPARFQPVVAVEVLAVEVAMDLYPIPDLATAPLPETVLYILRNFARPPAGQAKVTWQDRLPTGESKPRYMAAAGVREVLAHLRLGHTIQTGEQTATDLFRAYVKSYDRTADGSYVTLPVEEHRARYERCLSGDLVPFSSLAGWREFDFATLAKLFALRREIGEPESALLRLMMEQIVTRRAVDERKRAAHKRMTPRGTEADATSYERIRQALRRLTSEQRGVSRRRPVQLPVAGDVGISGSTTTGEWAFTLGGAVVRSDSPKYLNTLIHQYREETSTQTNQPAWTDRVRLNGATSIPVNLSQPLSPSRHGASLPRPKARRRESFVRPCYP